MKLTVTQSRLIMRRLKSLSRKLLSNLESHLKEQLVPQHPLAEDPQLIKRVTKLVYDNPQKAVSLLLNGFAGMDLGTHRWVQRYHNDRSRGYDQLNQLMTDLRDGTSELLSTVESDLLFKDDWDTGEYPQYLEDDLADNIMGLLTQNVTMEAEEETND